MKSALRTIQVTLLTIMNVQQDYNEQILSWTLYRTVPCLAEVFFPL